ncbi:MAG: PAS domain S-box protein [Methanosarcinaceae archaeon]|nr:PAS domain S-box protein [Methanosarcinaceae archaeon]
MNMVVESELGKKLMDTGSQNSHICFEKLINSLGEPLLILDYELKVLFANKSFYQFCTFASHDILGHSFPDTVDPSWSASDLRHFLTTLSNDNDHPVEFVIENETKDDVKCGFLLKAQIIDELVSSDAHILLIIECLSECGEPKTLSKYSDGIFSKIVENLSDGIVIVQNEKIQYSNLKFAEMLGYKPSDLLGNYYFDHILPEYQRIVSKKCQKCLDMNKEIPIKYDVVLISRKSFKMPVELTIIFFEFESRPAIMMTFRDITTKINTNKALKNIEKKFKMILEKTPIGLVYFDRDGLIDHFNEDFIQIFNDYDVDFSGHNILDILADGDIRSSVKKILNREFTLFEREYQIASSAGIRHIKIICRSIFLEGSFQGGIGIFKDITVRKETEKAMYLNQSRLEALLQLYEIENKPVSTIVEYVLSQVATLTDSEEGYISFIDSEGDLKETYWLSSSSIEMAPSKSELFQQSNIVERIERVLADKRSFFNNTTTNHTTDRSLNADLLHHHADVPIIKDGRIVLVFGLSNNKSNYIDLDFDSILIFLQSMWEMIIRKESKDALQFSEAKYSSLVENSNDGIVVIQNGVIQFANSMFCELIGYSIAGILGKPLFEFVSSEYQRMVEKKYGKHLTKHQKDFSDYNVDLSSKDGIIYPAQISASLIDYEGKLAIMAIVRDVTEQKLREDELLDSLEVQQVLQNIISSSSAIVFFWGADKDWPVDFVSDNISNFGYDPEEFISGKLRYGDIIHPSDLKDLQHQVYQYVAQGASKYSVEYRILTHSGKIRWVEERSSIKYNDKGDLLHFQGVILDITERKLAKSFLYLESDMDRFLGPSSNLQQTFDQILEFALKMDVVDCGALYLVDVSTGDLNIISSSGLSDEFIVSNSKYNAGSIQSRLFMVEYPLYKIYSDIARIGNLDQTSEDLLAMAIIPVHVEDNLVAVLFLASHEEYDIPFSVRTSLETVATQIGVVMERVEAEADLNKNQHDFHSLLNSIDDMVFVIDMKGCIRYANLQVSKKLGYSEEEITGINFIKMYPPDMVVDAANAFAEMISGNTYLFTLPLITKNGMFIQVNTKITRGEWEGIDVLVCVSREIIGD